MYTVCNHRRCTVLLNYNFILTRVSTSGATKYFACQMPEFPVEICISTRRDVAFRHGIYMRRVTWHFTRDGIVTITRDMVVLTKLNNRQDSSGLLQPVTDYMQQEPIWRPLNNK